MSEEETKALVKRLREYAGIAHMASAWGFAGEGYTMEKAADLIEKEVLNKKEGQK